MLTDLSDSINNFLLIGEYIKDFNVNAARDSILNLYIENDNNVNEIISKGHDKNTVKDIIKLVDKNEYKRRQSAPGIKVTSKNFGRDRRMPIANNYTKFIFNNIHKGNK